MQTLGEQDPYVVGILLDADERHFSHEVIRCEGVRTCTIESGGVAPVWDAHDMRSRFLLPGSARAERLVLQVWNDNAISSLGVVGDLVPDDLVGSVELKLSHLKRQLGSKRWYSLRYVGGS